jgi:hypothetical protein
MEQEIRENMLSPSDPTEPPNYRDGVQNRSVATRPHRGTKIDLQETRVEVVDGFRERRSPDPSNHLQEAQRLRHS